MTTLRVLGLREVMNRCCRKKRRLGPHSWDRGRPSSSTFSCLAGPGWFSAHCLRALETHSSSFFRDASTPSVPGSGSLGGECGIPTYPLALKPSAQVLFLGGFYWQTLQGTDGNNRHGWERFQTRPPKRVVSLVARGSHLPLSSVSSECRNSSVMFILYLVLKLGLPASLSSELTIYPQEGTETFLQKGWVLRTQGCRGEGRW